MSLDRVIDPRDREYVAGLDADDRDVVLETLARYRAPDLLVAGDELPDVEVFALEDGSCVRLVELLVGAPLVLVFGSFT
jgi:hypothetical protein